MKYLLSILLLASLNVVGQYIPPPPDNSPKENYGAIIIYRTWDRHMEQHGDAIGQVYSWEYSFQGFSDVKAALAWLNKSDESPYYQGSSEHWSKWARLSEDRLVAIYDLTTAKKINVSLKTEKKSVPKRVEMKAEEWTEQHYEIKNATPPKSKTK